MDDATGGRSDHLASLDLLRLLAIVLVTVQHAMSVTDHYALTQVGTLSLGQAGVALFCALSGFLAARDPRPASRWLWRRLLRIYPAYWIVMAASFVVTRAFHDKPFTAYQLLSQMAGIGFFTHGWELVNVVSWFISLILLCYTVTFVAKVTGKPILLYLSAAAVAGLLLAGHWESSLSRHMITFCLAGVCGLMGRRLPIRAGWIVAALVLCQWLNPQFLYGALSLLLLTVALALPTLSLPGGTVAGGYVYEYFLLHGIFLDGAMRLLPAYPGVAVALGIATAALGAISLRALLTWILPASRSATPATLLPRPTP